MENCKTFGIIYRATNKVNGKTYVGQTFYALTKRMTQHLSNAFNSNHIAFNTKFYKAIRKYGKDMFSWEMLADGLSENNIGELEKQYIKKYDSFVCGYNSTLGGEGTLGLKHTDSVKNKISKLSSQRNSGSGNPRFGALVSIDTRNKISLGNSGKIHSDEHKLKISKSLKNRIFSKETLKRMVKSSGGKQIDVYKDGKIMYSFYGQRECVRQLNLNRAILRKKIKSGKEYRGFVFRYKEETICQKS